jgi:cyclophilin family peptidyl-prolyl cis-trans isomerase
MRPLLVLLGVILVAIGIAAATSRFHQSAPPLAEKYAEEERQEMEKQRSEMMKKKAEMEARMKDPKRLAAFDDPGLKEGAVRVRLDIANRGVLTMELYPKVAPKTVAHFVALCKKNFYDRVLFHRVEKDFVIQAGDPTSKDIPDSEASALSAQELASKYPSLGSNGSGTNVPLEPGLPHLPFSVGLARSSARDSGDSQFYINLKDNVQLDNDYCIFGRVVEGQEVAKKVQVGDRITSLTVVP